MRYLAICCVLMLAIALAHTIPSQRIQGLRSLAKTKRNFGVQNTLINRLRDLKTKSSRHLHTLRQENSESSEDTEPDCKDVCDFESVWHFIWQWDFGDNFEQKLDHSIKCGLDKIKSMEKEFAEDYKKATDESLFSEEEIDKIWEVRLSGMDMASKIEEEEKFVEKAKSRFNEEGVEPRPGLVERYMCLKHEFGSILGFLGWLSSFERK